MWKYKMSFRLDKELVAARRRIVKFEAMARSTGSRRIDRQQEFRVSINFQHLEVSCSKSLQKENRLQEEISLCGDKTGRLEAQVLSFQHKVTALERALQDLEDKKTAVKQQVLKTEERNNAIEMTLASIQQQTRCLDSGDAELRTAIIEYESRDRILQSEKTILGEELRKARGEIFTRKSQVNKFIKDDRELSTGVSEEKRYEGRCHQENANGLNFTQTNEGVHQNEIELSSEESETKKADEESDHVRVLSNSNNFRDGINHEKAIQKKKNLWEESRETKKNGEMADYEYANNPCVLTDTSRKNQGFSDAEEEMAQTKFESESELSETRKFNQGNYDTAKCFQAIKCLSDGENNTAEKAQDKTEFLSNLSDTKKDCEECVQEKVYTVQVFQAYNSFSDYESCEEKSRDGNEFSVELGGTKSGDIERIDQENADTFQMFASRDLNDELEILEQKTAQKGVFETHHKTRGDEIGKFQGLTADVATKCATCQSEEDFLEEDLMKLRAKISLLESYINQLIQEKNELLAELNRTKENAEKGCQRITNSRPPNFHATDSSIEDELYEGATQKCLFFPLQTPMENCRHEIGCKLQHFAAELERKFATCKNEEKSSEEELIKLRANWLSTLESLINELIRDETGLVAEMNEVKEGVKTGVQRNVDMLHFLNTLISNFIDYQNREEATRKGEVLAESHKENCSCRDEIRKLWELATNLQAKYATCKIELEKQQALISGIISREEAATRAAREFASELHLKHVEIERRDVMIKTLTEDKTKLESIIQEFALMNGKNVECEEIKALCARARNYQGHTRR